MDYERRRSRAERINFLHHLKRLRLADAWRAVRPGANCTDASAAQLARREIDWLNEEREKERADPNRSFNLFAAIRQSYHEEQKDRDSRAAGP